MAASHRAAVDKLRAVAVSIRFSAQEPLQAVYMHRASLLCKADPEKAFQVTAWAGWVEHTQVPSSQSGEAFSWSTVPWLWPPGMGCLSNRLWWQVCHDLRMRLITGVERIAALKMGAVLDAWRARVRAKKEREFAVAALQKQRATRILQEAFDQ